MRALWPKVRRKLGLPLPELASYCLAVVGSLLWARQLGSVGRRFHVSLGARIQGGRSISIGERFFAGRGLWIEAVERYLEFAYSPKIVIGDNVVFSESVHIAATSSVTIGNGVLIGSRAHVTDHGHGTYSGARQSSPASVPSLRELSSGRPVVIHDNVWLGDGVIVLPGVSIGAGTVVGANSVVSRDLPAAVMAVGAPARAIKRFDVSSACWVKVDSP